jgi:hypothetical protein
LHVFSDASAAAYGAVAYLRSELDGQVAVRLDMAAAKITPPQGISIPKAELLGAVMGAQLASQIRKTLGLRHDQVTMWTDSQNVLAWIKNPDIELMMFVHNRVKTILGCTEGTSWRWVETENNPADHLSRGRTMDKLLDLDQWWKGPDFLVRDPSSWPKDKREPKMTEEGAKEVRQARSTSCSPDSQSRERDLAVLATRATEAAKTHFDKLAKDYQNFNSWARLIRTMATVRAAGRLWLQRTRLQDGGSGHVPSRDEVVREHE